MMKKTSIVLVVLCSLFFSSCLNTIEEIFLKKDGSGEYQLTFDMSELFTNPFLSGMIEEELKKDSTLGLDEQIEIDTTVFFTDMPDSIKQKVDDPEFWEKVYMKMNISKNNSKMVSTLHYDFDKVEDIAKLFKGLESMGDADASGLSMFSGMGLLPSSSLFKMSKKKLIRSSQPETTDVTTEDMGQEGMEMMKMFMGDAKHTTIYHLPGKVKKTSIERAKIDGKTLTVESKLLDMMDKKVLSDGEIKFK